MWNVGSWKNVFVEDEKTRPIAVGRGRRCCAEHMVSEGKRNSNKNVFAFKLINKRNSREVIAL